jgi:peptidoglycan/LPS O-acetylase OafA/YrhL
MTTTIAGAFHGRDNNFNLIRFLAASAVLIDHCFALVPGEQAAAALVDPRPFEIGRLAVDVFFIVSGFLVTRSVLTQPTLIDYGVARVLRLFPALLVACIAIAFILGPAVSLVSPRDYFSDPRPWVYVPLTAGLITHTLTLPGVFDNVPESGIINSPLWTLRYESFCYLLLALFALAGLLRSRAGAGLVLGTVFAVYGFLTFATDWRGESSALDSSIRFLLDFFLGGALYVYADKIRLSFGVAVALAVAAALTYATPLFEVSLRIALAYGVIFLALVPAGAIRSFNLAGDYSYGLYILCFPIQQSFVMLDPGLTPGALLAVSFPAVLAFAILSWHFVEHPALQQKAWVGARLQAAMNALRQRRSLAVLRRPDAQEKSLVARFQAHQALDTHAIDWRQ